jgi:hypothetical protein
MFWRLVAQAQNDGNTKEDGKEDLGDAIVEDLLVGVGRVEVFVYFRA